MDLKDGPVLEPPNPQLQSRSTSPGTLESKQENPIAGSDHRTSLSINYLPSKFSKTVLSGGPKRRKVWKSTEIMLPKRGGGREAFRSDEARMPDGGDDDYNGIVLRSNEGGRKSKPRWNRFKWALFLTNILFTIYSIGGLIFCLLIWFNDLPNAAIIRLANHTELILSTFAASLGILTALIGHSGVLLNNRTFLAVYCTLLFACFALLVAPGYTAYKRRAFDLEGKINEQWSRDLGLTGRLVVQDQLHCCGYFSPFVEATVSATCYARSVLPGCKAPYLRFERKVLEWWYTVVFALVPAQIFVMVAGLLCSNHVTYRFGKGMMPKAYRLDADSLTFIMQNYASQLAEQYGKEVAKDVVARSRSTLQLDAIPMVRYSGNSSSTSTASMLVSSSRRASNII
ncbi:uncharacterized protein LAESUDRAFT_794680 [Laetiporus sulphureus 93-53]|uniref:Tetraspanin Tsp2 n=1 Tax=Laetiporus sulphureus 93-53 TaxID=1314785 RepID=A0A165C2F2_9APHY|nr:uncharacterized protein LAESUDRAFT_794680 [Laetiporus sulphureus 93-53]KZT02079.1 hypothetical protein LAESUDRAFT_794680 [Laetiporus sulphureus 93-53]